MKNGDTLMFAAAEILRGNHTHTHTRLQTVSLPSASNFIDNITRDSRDVPVSCISIFIQSICLFGFCPSCERYQVHTCLPPTTDCCCCCFYFKNFTICPNNLLSRLLMMPSDNINERQGGK